MAFQNPEDCFKFIREIGSGSYGKCMLCERKTDRSKIVMKKVTLNMESRDEAYMLNRIQHDNVVRIFQSYASQRNIYMILEYMPGGTLAKMMDRPLKEKQIANFSGQLGSALECVHGMGIVHRDVKPANILLSEDRKFLKLCDFGVALQLKEGERAKGSFHNVGTINYMAPEIIGGRFYDQKSDIWSLGCVIYEMVERKRAFPGDQQLAIYNKISNRIIAFPEHSKFADFIKSLIIVQPNQRPTAKEVIDLLANQKTVVSKK